MSDGTRPRIGQPPGTPAPGISPPGDDHPNGLGSAPAGAGQAAPSGRATAATVTACAAALGSVLVTAYWALGGRGLISTRRIRRSVCPPEGAAPVLLALTAAAAKAASLPACVRASVSWVITHLDGDPGMGLEVVVPVWVGRRSPIGGHDGEAALSLREV